MEPVQAKLTCSDCGNVQVPYTAITVWFTDTPHMTLNCPNCGKGKVLPCPEAIVPALHIGGARVEVIPEEALEAHTGEAITEADCTQFATWLAHTAPSAVVARIETEAKP